MCVVVFVILLKYNAFCYGGDACTNNKDGKQDFNWEFEFLFRNVCVFNTEGVCPHGYRIIVAIKLSVM